VVPAGQIGLQSDRLDSRKITCIGLTWRADDYAPVQKTIALLAGGLGDQHATVTRGKIGVVASLARAFYADAIAPFADNETTLYTSATISDDLTQMKFGLVDFGYREFDPLQIGQLNTQEGSSNFSRSSLDFCSSSNLAPWESACSIISQALSHFFRAKTAKLERPGSKFLPVEIKIKQHLIAQLQKGQTCVEQQHCTFLIVFRSETEMHYIVSRLRERVDFIAVIALQQPKTRSDVTQHFFQRNASLFWPNRKLCFKRAPTLRRLGIYRGQSGTHVSKLCNELARGA
jgi:hypothetical protein